MCVTFHKGPIGYAVALNGQPVGVIKRIPSIRGYLVAIDGFRPGDGNSKPFNAGVAGVTPGETGHVFQSLKAAKAKVEEVLCPA